MFINYARREINLKIVYYGPGLSGKTTNLECIFKHIDPKLRSDLVTLNTREERTLYFDFMQLEFAPIKGKKPKFNLYTVPGQVYYNFSRKIILRGVDGLVFVADSQRSRMPDNLDSLLDLEKNMIEMGLSLQNVPWVIQYNKRDLADVESLEVLESKLNFFGVPYFESVANNGVAVFPTLQKILSDVVAKAHNQIN
jgi:hypothetical protein